MSLLSKFGKKRSPRPRRFLKLSGERLEDRALLSGADLVGTFLSVVENEVFWGNLLRISYTVENQGSTAVTGFDADVYLSNDNVISSTDLLLTSLSFAGLSESEGDNAVVNGLAQVLLPHAPPSGFFQGTAFLGFILNPTGSVAEADFSNNSNRGAGRDLSRVPLVGLFTELESNNSISLANPISFNSRTTGFLDPSGDTDVFLVSLPSTGRLTIDMTSAPAGELDGRLRLLDAQGTVLATSDDRSRDDRNPILHRHLLPGTYFLETSASGTSSQTGQYLLTTQFVQALSPSSPLPLERFTFNVLVADFNGDSIEDVAAMSSATSEVAVFLGNDDGSFRQPQLSPIGKDPADLVVADFNSDGILDLATANGRSNTDAADLSLLLGLGDGRFLAQKLPVKASALVADDFDGDQIVDLIVADFASQFLLFLRGIGNGTFRSPLPLNVGPSPGHLVISDLVSGDLDGNNRPDVIFSYFNNADPIDQISKLVVLLNNGEQGFDPPAVYTSSAFTPEPITVGDVDKDGDLDLALPSSFSSEVYVFANEGDGTFAPPARLKTGLFPRSVNVEDINRDGVPDLAVANSFFADVSIFLGAGQGAFQSERRYATGGAGQALVSDFNRDGFADLAVVRPENFELSRAEALAILFGRPDATFPEVPNKVGSQLESLASADFNRDGRMDLAVANGFPGDISVLLNSGDGRFRDEVRYPVNIASPLIFTFDLLTADLNKDGRQDLAVLGAAGSPFVSVLLGLGNGQFQLLPPTTIEGSNPDGLAAGFVDGDDNLDLLVRYRPDEGRSPTALFGLGDGRFTPGASPLATAFDFGPHVKRPADFNGDGRTDQARLDSSANVVSILLGQGNGSFLDTAKSPLFVFQPVPYLLDINADPTSDLVLLNESGMILLRLGRSDEIGAFEPPTVINIGNPALAMSPIAGQRPMLAAIDKGGATISIYTFETDGKVTRSGVFATGILPVRLGSADLNNDGWGDLVVVNAGSGTLDVFLGGSSGFRLSKTVTVGNTPADVQFADVDGRNGVDILAANTASADVSVLLNDPLVPFSTHLRFAAATGLYGMEESAQGGQVTSDAGSADLVTGDFDNDRLIDLVVVNNRANTFSLLRGKGTGDFMPPAEQLVGSGPSAVAAAHFDNDNQLDLAVLNRDSNDVWILTRTASGGFAHTGTINNTGSTPVGLTVADINRDSKADLLLASDFGDPLIFLGNGDGSFAPFRRLNSGIPLAVADLDGDDRDDFVFANAALDRVSVQFGTSAVQPLQSRANGILGPEAVKLADLNNDSRADLIVANSAANNVLIYLGDGQGGFRAPQSFFTGTNPVGLTLSDLNNDGRLDLVVANRGSNDVTPLFGQGTASAWTLTAGPRLNSGGAGPVATAVQDMTGDQIPDLLISNSQSNTLAQLAGRGGGFFNDLRPLIFAVGAGPGQIIPFAPGAAAVLNTLDDSLSVLSGAAVNTFSSGGLNPVRGFSGDFDGDSFADLVVANRGNGIVSLLLGTETGFLPAQFLAFDNPSDLVFAGLDGNLLSVYLTREGQEGVARLTFTVEGGIPVVFGEGGAGSGENRFQFVNLTRLDAASLPVVPVVETGRDPGLEDLLLLLISPGGVEESDLLYALSAETEILAASAETTALDLFILGLEEMDDQIRHRFQLQREPEEQELPNEFRPDRSSDMDEKGGAPLEVPCLGIPTECGSMTPDSATVLPHACHDLLKQEDTRFPIVQPEPLPGPTVPSLEHAYPSEVGRPSFLVRSQGVSFAAVSAILFANAVFGPEATRSRVTRNPAVRDEVPERGFVA